jgi:hypothetical protein
MPRVSPVLGPGSLSWCCSSAPGRCRRHAPLPATFWRRGLSCAWMVPRPLQYTVMQAYACAGVEVAVAGGTEEPKRRHTDRGQARAAPAPSAQHSMSRTRLKRRAYALGVFQTPFGADELMMASSVGLGRTFLPRIAAPPPHRPQPGKLLRSGGWEPVWEVQGWGGWATGDRGLLPQGLPPPLPPLHNAGWQQHPDGWLWPVLTTHCKGLSPCGALCACS